MDDETRAKEIREMIEAAERTQCACGGYGDWNHAVTREAGPGVFPCVWAGCPNCRKAVGVPLLPGSLAWYREYMAART